MNNTTIEITCEDIKAIPRFIGELLLHQHINVEDVEYTGWNDLYVDDEYSFVVEYSYTHGSPGSMYNRHGDPGDPPEPDEYEIESAILSTNNKELEMRAVKARRLLSRNKKKLKQRHKLRRQIYNASLCDEIDLLDFIDEEGIVSMIENNAW